MSICLYEKWGDLMKRKICFFNVDGLLNKSSDWRKPFTINYDLTNIFCRFLAKHDLIPVMTSSWRIGFNKSGDMGNAPYIKELEAIFARYGLRIYDKTPILKGRPRDKEIERFLYFHHNPQYIVIDGDPDEYEKADSHVCFIDPESGFTKKDAHNAERLLRKIERGA